MCTDTGVFSESVSNYLTEAARNEYNLFTRNERFERVQTRLQRVEHFIDYLHEEEKRERELYSLGMPEEEMFTYASKKAFVTERSRVLASAVKTKAHQEIEWMNLMGNVA